ncbi:MAG: Asp-tRNA(Asn)/Glu-tRNA(Gln) amidotransferase subunit GatC [Dongiaceae bacterium]
MAIDRKTVAHIATLARIRLAPEEQDALARELDTILHWVEQLGEVDTAGIQPMAGVGNVTLRQRPDAVTDGGYPEKVVRNAPAAAAGFFAVPKVVE